MTNAQNEIAYQLRRYQFSMLMLACLEEGYPMTVLNWKLQPIIPPEWNQPERPAP